MSKKVILVTGTPCVGKTSVAHLLTSKLDALYVNLTELATREGLISGKDEQRNSLIVDEGQMRQKICDIIENCDKTYIVIDGHYAVSVVSEELVTHVFVLRRNPVELHKFMRHCGFSGNKLWENLASEILDICLVDALNIFGEGKVCELNITSRSVENVVNEILDILSGYKQCLVGFIDWLDKLENAGLLGDYLKV